MDAAYSVGGSETTIFCQRGNLPGFAQAHVEHGFDRIVPVPPFYSYTPKIKVLRRKKEGAGAGAGAGAADAQEEETFFGDV